MVVWRDKHNRGLWYSCHAPAGGAESPPAIRLEIFDAFVTMADGEYPVAGDHQVGIHQAGQAPDDDVADIGGDQAQAFSVEITDDGAVVISFARTVLT